MKTMLEHPEKPADKVSRETIRRMNFLTGSSLKDLRNVTVVLGLRGKRYEVHFDAEGRVRTHRAD